MANTIKINGKTISYTTKSETSSVITFNDGTVLTVVGSVAQAAILKAYQAAKATIVPPSTPIPPVVIPPLTDYTTVGSGSGNIDLGNISGKSLKIKPGTYGNITIGECSGAKIDATGVQMAKDASLYFTKNSTGIDISGLKWDGQSYRAIFVQALIKGLNMHDVSFKNVSNAVISDEWNGVWDGTDATAKTDWRIDNCIFDNCGPGLISKGSVYENGSNKITGLFKNLKMSNVTVKNCNDMGSFVAIVCDGYDIEAPIIENVNMHFPDKSYPNGYHNGIFMMTGNGKIHGATCKNHQGNLIRAWAMSFSNTPATIEMYDSKVFNSWKYSALELQTPPFLLDFLNKNKGKYTYANAKVYGNTAGKLSVSKDWDGQLLDLYNIAGGSLEYHDNKGFEMVASNPEYHPVSNMINNMSDVKVTESNNKYYKTQLESGILI